MDLGLKGKRALVVGASRGLGFATAKALAAEGVHTVSLEAFVDVYGQKITEVKENYIHVGR